MQQRPDKALLLQALLPEAEAILIPVQDFNAISVSVRKHEQRRLERIYRHSLRDNHRQPIDLLAEVNRRFVQVHRHRLGPDRKHYRLARRSSSSGATLTGTVSVI